MASARHRGGEASVVDAIAFQNVEGKTAAGLRHAVADGLHIEPIGYVGDEIGGVGVAG